MNKAQKAVQQAQFSDEKKTIKQLQRIYDQARKDCEQKIRELSSRTDLENLQTIIYQKQYQEALKKQLDGIIDNLNGQEFTSVADYLQKSYHNGYCGVMYDLAGQGIPITIPINQEQVVKALQTDSKLSKSLYFRLGEDTDYLKKSIRTELSRGIANGSTWNQIAGHIAKGMNSPFDKAINNAIRISRTEGHRIQQKSALDAQHAAKDKGADVLKQWDSTMDNRTRPHHRQLDGQIRELDEPFEVDGMTADAPGHFGRAKEDCNCRCCLLQRARWALDQDELDELKERAAYFGLDKSKDFDEFKQKYLQLPDNADTIEIPKEMKDIQDFGQLKKYMKDTYDISVDKSVENLNFQIVHKTMTGVEGIFKDYPELGKQVQTISTKSKGVMCCSGTEIYFNPSYYQDETKFAEMCKHASSTGWWPANSTPSSIGAHETGHAVERLLLNLDTDYAYEFERILDWNKGARSGEIVSQALKNVKKTSYGKGKKNAELMQALSGYGATKKQECFAEAFADVASNGDNANPLSIEIKKLAKEEYEKLKGK